MSSVQLDVQRINKKLRKVANSLDLKERKKIYRAAAKPLIKQAKSNTPKDTGALRKSIKVLPFARRQDAVYVGPRVIKGKDNQPFYAYWIEYGKKGYEGAAYMRRAYESTKELVLGLVQTGLSERYKKEIRNVSGR